MKRVTAIYAALQSILVGWLLSSGSLPSSAQNAEAGDESAWSQARELGTVEAFEGYLGDYPGGQHASEAFRCIVELMAEATDGECVAPTPPDADPLEGASRGFGSMDVY